tara:strand:- start:510 stop:980 length:471 start_codon:yes stop_codon:yes gene_type:complete
MELQYKGLWLFGLSGSGKTFASRSVSYTIDNSFIIDGDDVRELISFDLDYDLDSRLIQLKRIFGITKIALKNNYFPIISSVYMSKELEIALKNNNILTIKVLRDIKEARKGNRVYDNESNIVGVDIAYPHDLNSISIENCGGEEFCQSIQEILYSS